MSEEGIDLGSSGGYYRTLGSDPQLEVSISDSFNLLTIGAVHISPTVLVGVITTTKAVGDDIRGTELLGEDLELGLDIMNKGLPSITVSIDTQTLGVKTGLVPIGYPLGLESDIYHHDTSGDNGLDRPPGTRTSTKGFVDRLGVIG